MKICNENINQLFYFNKEKKNNTSKKAHSRQFSVLYSGRENYPSIISLHDGYTEVTNDLHSSYNDSVTKNQN